jgi:hypothetical protein
MNRNLVGWISGKSFTKIAHFVSNLYRQFLFLVGQFLTKQIFSENSCQMNRNLVGSIYGRSSIKIIHFVPIRYQAWPLYAILVSGWLISKKYSPLKPLSQMNRNLLWWISGKSSIQIAYFVPIIKTIIPNQLNFGSNHPWKVLYNISSI